MPSGRLIAALVIAGTLASTSGASASDRYAKRHDKWCGVVNLSSSNYKGRVGVEARWADSERLACATARSVTRRWLSTKRDPRGWQCTNFNAPHHGKGWPGHGSYIFAWWSCSRPASSRAIVGYIRESH